MYFEQISTPGLGCYSYAIGSPAAGVMAVVDPRRDIGIYLSIAEEHDMRVTHIFDTHVHADHISGARELRAATGADIYIHENASVGYEAKKLKDGDAFSLGETTIRVLYTPGHTPNSVSLLATDRDRSSDPEMLLTGDLLFVGDIGRPDLPGEEVLDEQVANLYNSLYKIVGALPDYLEVYPAHGEGSLCGQGMSAKQSSTLGYERLANPMLNYADFASFRNDILSSFPMRPQSFSSIIAANLKGADLTADLDNACAALAADRVSELLADGVIALDMRETYSFAAAHIPGSINVDFTKGPKLNWVGMAVPPGAGIILVLPDGMDCRDIYVEMRRIGYDSVKGWLKGGIDEWIGQGFETRGFPHLSVSELKERLSGQYPPRLVDVRTPREFAGVSITGAVNYTFDRLVGAEPCPFDTGEEIVVICQSGFRAGIAASLLQAKGFDRLSVLSGGMQAWAESRQMG